MNETLLAEFMNTTAGEKEIYTVLNGTANGKAKGDFAYAATTYEVCNDMELSYSTVVILIGVFVVLLVIVVVSTILSRNYQKKYRERMGAMSEHREPRVDDDADDEDESRD